MKCYFRGCSNQIKPDGIYDKFDQINKSISEYSINYDKFDQINNSISEYSINYATRLGSKQYVI